MLLRISSTVFMLAVLLVNALANTLPINGLTTGQVADRYPSFFTPAGFTFSIWSVIYILLVGFVVLTWFRRNDERLDKILLLFILSCALNITWILVWHHLLSLVSVGVMLCLLVVLTLLFLQTRQAFASRPTDVLFIKLPFAIYFAWICVATIANISAHLSSTRWEQFGISDQYWTVIMLAVAAALGAWLSVRFRAPAVAVVLIWTQTGVYFRWRSEDVAILVYTPLILACILAVAVYFSFRRRGPA